MSQRRRWILLPLAALAAIVVVLIALFDWNWLRGPIGAAASAAVGRDVEIAGDLEVDLSTTPIISLRQVRIANAPWGSRPDMLVIPQVDVAITLSALFRGDIELPFLHVREPDLLLETNEAGEGNWQFGPDEEPGAPPIPIIEDLAIAQAAIRYRRPGLPEDLLAQLETVGGAITRAAVHLDAAGTLNQEPLSLRLASAPVERLEPETAARRFPFQLEARLGSTLLAATGSAEQPLEAQGLSVDIALESEQPGALLALAGREPSDLGPLILTAGVTRRDEIWRLRNLDLRLGESDLSGDVSFSTRGDALALSAALRSREIRLAEVRTLIALLTDDATRAPDEPTLEATVADAKEALGPDADQGGAPAVPEPARSMPALDAAVSWQIERLSGPDLLVHDLAFVGGMRDRLPYLVASGAGQYQDQPVTLALRIGDDGANGAAGDGAYPVEARIDAAATRFELDGVIDEPRTLGGLDLEVQASSEDVNRLLALASVDAPQIPPFAIFGHVVQHGKVWHIGDFYGQFSESEITGQITADLSADRPFVSADLQSSRLLVSDLVTAGDRAAVIDAEVADAPVDAGPGEDAEGKDGGAAAAEAALISLEGLNFEALPRIDADISFQGQFVAYQDLRFDQLQFDLRLRDRIAVLDAAGEGRYRDGPLRLEARLGADETLEDPDARYPIDLQIASEETWVSVQGTSAEPARLAGLDVDVVLAGPDMNRLGEILDLPLPATPPFEMRGQLTRGEENRWNLTGLTGTVGDSDIQGDAAIILGGARPLLEVELTSDTLDLDDLGLVVGVPPDPGETASAEQARAAAEQAARPRLLSDEPFDVPELRAVDARISYRAAQVQAQQLPLEEIAVDLTLEDGLLTLEPLRFGIADGTVESVVRFDARDEVLAGDLQLDLRDVRLNQLLGRFDIDIGDLEMEEKGVGTFRAHAGLAVRGNSVAELAGSAEGQVAVIMGGGRINALIIEGLGLDIGEALLVLFTGEDDEQSEMVPVRCFVGDFGVQGGIMRAEALVLDTEDATITGQGQIDLGAEALGLEFAAHPKDASILTASTPVRVGGTWKEPEIEVLTDELQEKALAALGLGVILPVVGAVLPFIETGDAVDENCGRLIDDAVASVEEASPSPPSE